jgi:hypothetical protein
MVVQLGIEEIRPGVLVAGGMVAVSVGETVEVLRISVAAGVFVTRETDVGTEDGVFAGEHAPTKKTQRIQIQKNFIDDLSQCLLYCSAYGQKNLPNGSRYPLGVGGWIRSRNGTRQKPEKRSKTRCVPQVGCTHC